MSLIRLIALAAAVTLPAPARAIHLDGGRITIPTRNVGSVDLARLPIGDQKTSTRPRRGHIWLCGRGPGVPQNYQQNLPWVHGSTWDLRRKAVVQGAVGWDDASFSNTIQGPTRLLAGNSLPVGHTTGIFPSAGSGPDSIHAMDYRYALPASPTVNAAPQCMGMEVGISSDGVPLYNGFDANLYDAGVHELQDDCSGHPNQASYHRHTPPLCFRDPGRGQSRLIGYAYDGFGIYGHRGPKGKVMRNGDLDACHGITSTVRFNGRRVRMYHYVATYEFPYTVGCYRGTPIDPRKRHK